MVLLIVYVYVVYVLVVFMIAPTEQLAGVVPKHRKRSKPIEMRQTQIGREDRHEEREGALQWEQQQQAKEEKKKDACGRV